MVAGGTICKPTMGVLASTVWTAVRVSVRVSVRVLWGACLDGVDSC